MRRFYIPVQNISGDKIIIEDKKQIRHLRDVLRLKAKDEIIIFDNQGNEYNCSIEELTDKAILKINRKLNSRGKKSIQITVACAIPKKSKMDDIVDKLTQLGVDRIIPMETERVIIKLDKDKKISRLKRWQNIALSASQQSQRSILPILEPIQDIKQVLSKAEDFDLRLMPALIKKQRPLKEVLNKSKPRNILILIGPEGDFTPEEVNLAKQAGCILISLGNLVLRVDTAALAAVSYITLHQVQS